MSGGLWSLSACETVRDIRSLIKTGDFPKETEAEKAAHGAEHDKQVAVLIQQLNDTSTAWSWAWNSGNPTYGPEAQSRRVQAAYALGHEFMTYSAIPDLALALKDKDPDLRVNASASLLAMADHASSAQAALQEALNDSYYRVRLNAIYALLKMGVPNAELMPVLDSVTASSSVAEALEAGDLLITMGRDPKGLVPILLWGMGDPEMCETVIDDLGDQYENLAYLPVLLTGLNSKNMKCVAGSVGLLGGPTYASPEVTAALKKASSDWDVDIRASAAGALVVGGSSSLHDDVGTVAGPGAGAANESIAKLLKLVNDRDETVRRVAVESLGRLKDASPEVIAALRAKLKDHDEDVQEAAADALGAIGKPAKAAVPDLWAIWNDSRKPQAGKFDWVMGSAAARALSYGMGEEVEDGIYGWYDASWGMSRSQVLAAFQKDGLALTEGGGPPTVLGIDHLDCGCGPAGARCTWTCSLAPPAGDGPTATIPVSVTLLFDPSDRLTKVLLQSHIGDSSRCQDIGKIFAGLEWTYSTTHTRTQVPSPDGTILSYHWALATSSLTYQAKTTQSTCEMELAYANDDPAHPSG